uniref:PH domain-containing protein n=1 Tax=Neolamprologus brichardi TaxID=32507 RepID=A0A3Q4G981_NEOBR
MGGKSDQRIFGDPDVLEYYKNDHSKKPIRVIDLQCCEQVDAGLTFKRKEFQDSYVFDIKTVDRTFYLVAETEEEMNKWVLNSTSKGYRGYINN